MKLGAVKSAISLYWFFQRSSQLNTGENSSNLKNTNISNTAQTNEVLYKGFFQ